MTNTTSSTVSANTLFHFTDKIEYLLGILTHNFYPRYCLEDHSAFFPADDKDVSERAIPMVCFCDIPLSNIRNHRKIYGDYAIGLTKEWGIRNRISPVTYFLDNSVSVEGMSKCFQTIFSNLNKVKEHSESIETPIPLRDKGERLTTSLSFDLAGIHNVLLQSMGFTKKYRGDFVKGDKPYSNFCFYDEREWRYMPNLLSLQNEKSFIDKGTFSIESERIRLNKYLEENGHALEFSPSDVKYIIVGEEREIPSMITKIGEIKGRKYSEDDIALLRTRLISMEQVLQDF